MVKYLKYLLSPFNSNFNSNMSKVLVNYSTLVVEVEKQKDDILLSEPKIQNNTENCYILTALNLDHILETNYQICFDV